MKRILVTGGAGFIGSNFIQYMLETYPDLQVINLDKLTYAGNLENLRAVERDSRYSFFQGDIADRQVVMELLSRKKVDAIVNFAAETHVDRSILRPDDFLKTDIFGVFALLEAARHFSIARFVQISTDEVYGPIPEGAASEASPLAPSSPYSASKGGADLLCHAYFVTYNVPVVVTRAANNYGPYQYPEKFIPLFITNALEDKPLPLYGDGRQVREWLYVTDHCRAIDRVLREGRPGEIYNIGGYSEEQNRVIAETIVELCKKSPELITFVEDRPGHDVRYALDSSKIKALGWEPRVSLEEGLAKTVAWYKKNKDWWKKIKEADFKNYYTAQYGKRLQKKGPGNGGEPGNTPSRS
ncbi:MAG TPA: dTDP-glucose 4,6-dehydratase [bacterium]|nr:dTDP-glucose 4,6-dehydratase [Candidatus Omnitrophota bacterium]HOL94896.1 dTDP-glucose 4,6-dehydratase [bacterium]HXK92064.1 dTDP-glucose 4,6-dehydratase [bacterium]